MSAAVAGLFAVHEADGGENESANVPGGCPAFLVVVGEGGADGHVDVEAAGRGVEDEFGGSKGIVFVQFEDSVVVPAAVGSFEVVEAEVELEGVFASDYGVAEGLFIEGGLLLHESLEGEFFSLHQS